MASPYSYDAPKTFSWKFEPFIPPTQTAVGKALEAVEAARRAQAALDAALAGVNGTPEERRAAALYFARRRDPDYLETLNALAADCDDETRLTAVKGIVRLMAPESTPFLIAKLEDPHPVIRMAACWGLCHRGTSEVVDALCRQWTIEKEPAVDTCLVHALAFIHAQTETPPEAKYVINAMRRVPRVGGPGLRM